MADNADNLRLLAADEDDLAVASRCCRTPLFLG